MKTLPAPLAFLGKYNQFTLWRSEWNASKRKYDKKPISHETRNYTDYTDKNNLTDYQTALNAINTWAGDCGLAFVLFKNDPFFLLDIDKCYINNQWSELAINLINRFPGAAVEVSSSGAGLHILGCATVGNHAKKNTEKNIEFYTDKRLVSLTGTHITGSIHTDHTRAANQLIEDYFKPELTEGLAGWTDKPHPHWRGPTDDDELIKKMLNAKNVRTIFGAGAACSFLDLWQGNEQGIAKIYPASGDLTCPYDRSSADIGLCIQLAWWTGGDCERIERLFAKSNLVRDKWINRDDYREETIINAVRICKGFLGEDAGKREANAVPVVNPVRTVEPEIILPVRLLAGPRVVAFADRAEFFKNHYYLRKLNKVLCPDGLLRDQTAYNGCYAGYEFLEQYGGTKPIRDPWRAYVTAPDVERMEAHDVAYLPAKPFLSTVSIHRKSYVNIYENFDIAPVAGDPSPFVNHLKKILPSPIDFNVLVSFIAAFLQYPGKKFLWAPFIQGAEGCGKSIITKVIKTIIGEEHVYQINPDDFCATGGKFNKYMQFSRLGVLEELRVGDRKAADPALKRMIDHDRIEIQAKGVDQYTATICMNVIINSNFQDALPIDESSRRYAPLFCAQQTSAHLIRDGMTPSYFIALMNWLDNENGYAICANYLLNYQIPFETNPATGATRAPFTTTFKVAVQESMSQVESAICDAIANGEPGTKNGWVSVQAMKMYLLNDDVKFRSLQQICKALEKMGYKTIPLLESRRFRTNQIIMNEGGKYTKLYVLPDHPILTEETTQSKITEQYRLSQGYASPTIGIIR